MVVGALHAARLNDAQMWCLLLHAAAVDGNKVVDDDEEHGGDAESVRDVGQSAVRDHRGWGAIARKGKEGVLKTSWV